MFRQTFKAVFGVGAAIVATGALAGAAIGGFWLVSYLVENPGRQSAADLRASEAARNAFCAEVNAIQVTETSYRPRPVSEMTFEEREASKAAVLLEISRRRYREAIGKYCPRA